MWKALLSALLIALLLLPAGCVFDSTLPPSLMPDPAPLIKPRLTAFKDEDEFYRYLQDLREMGEASGMWWSGAGLAPETLIASADTEIPCDPRRRRLFTGRRGGGHWLPAFRAHAGFCHFFECIQR